MWAQVAKDNLKACLPFKPALRRALRAVSPYASLPTNDAMAVTQGLQLLRLARQHQLSLETVMEVGTGWIPTLPQMLKAAGAGRLILTDVEPLCDAHTTRHARALVERALEPLADATGLDAATLKSNLDRANVEGDGLGDYRCPPALDRLTDGSVSLIYSRTVLEHIARPLLVTLIREWTRLLRPGGAVIHFIDNSDHFEHRNKRLSRVHFLTHPDWAWRLACLNLQNYQNRLRHSDYLDLFNDAGYELLYVEGEPDAQARADLDQLAVNPRFRAYDKDDLAILTTVLVARPPASPKGQADDHSRKPI